MNDPMTTTTDTSSTRRRLRVLMVCVQPREQCESFIRNQIGGLDADVTILHGVPFPSVTDDGVAFATLGRRAWSAFLRAAAGHNSRQTYSAALASFLHRRRFDVVLAQFGFMGVPIADGCRMAGVPLVVHFHGVDATGERYIVDQKGGYHRMFEVATSVIAVSKPMVEQLVSLGADRQKIKLNPYGVDLSRFSGANPAESNPRFVFVGRFVPKKAPYLVLESFRRVIAKRPDARLTMIGDGPMLEVCQRLRSAWQLGASVDLHPRCSHEEVATHLRACRAYVQHSVKAADGDCEGTPVVILEASATGLPVISTRHAGIPESVVDGTTGLLVDEGDTQGMAAAMVKFIDDPHLADAMGQAGQKHIANHYELKTRLEALLAVLHDAAKSSG